MDPSARMNPLPLPPVCHGAADVCVFQTQTMLLLAFSVPSEDGVEHFRLLKLMYFGLDLSRRPQATLDQRVYSWNDVVELCDQLQATQLARGAAILGQIRFVLGHYLVLSGGTEVAAELGGHRILRLRACDNATADVDLVSSQKTQLALVPLFIHDANLRQRLRLPKIPSSALAAELRHRKAFNASVRAADLYLCSSLDLNETLQVNMLRHVTRPVETKFEHTCKPEKLDCENEPVSPELEASLGRSCRGKFVWNAFILRNFLATLSASYARQGGDADTRWSELCWMLPHLVSPVMHGFVEQRHLTLHGRVLSLTVLARRSRFFAGTRYLRRGATDSGYCANHVETEQWLHDRVATHGHPSFGAVTSFVQVRGSIPLYWQQVPNAMTPRPPIRLRRLCHLALPLRRHLRRLVERYGTRVTILNLIKQEEAHARETILGTPFKQSVAFVQSVLDITRRQARERYGPTAGTNVPYVDMYNLDFKRLKRRKRGRTVTDVLQQIGECAVRQSGIFSSAHALSDLEAGETPFVPLVAWLQQHEKTRGGVRADRGREKRGVRSVQRGVLRSNCVDSLDRTGAAQGVVAQVALQQQCRCLGVPTTPSLSRQLQLLLDRCGDTLAWQYGGSQMHRQLRKEQKEQTQQEGSSKLITSVRRHLANAFTDKEKQDGMDLFLGAWLPLPVALDENSTGDRYIFRGDENRRRPFVVPPDPSRTVFDDALLCLACGAANVQNRRFCRSDASLLLSAQSKLRCSPVSQLTHFDELIARMRFHHAEGTAVAASLWNPKNLLRAEDDGLPVKASHENALESNERVREVFVERDVHLKPETASKASEQFSTLRELGVVREIGPSGSSFFPDHASDEYCTDVLFKDDSTRRRNAPNSASCPRSSKRDLKHRRRRAMSFSPTLPNREISMHTPNAWSTDTNTEMDSDSDVDSDHTKQSDSGSSGWRRFFKSMSSQLFPSRSVRPSMDTPVPSEESDTDGLSARVPMRRWVRGVLDHPDDGYITEAYDGSNTTQAPSVSEHDSEYSDNESLVGDAASEEDEATTRSFYAAYLSHQAPYELIRHVTPPSALTPKQHVQSLRRYCVAPACEEQLSERALRHAERLRQECHGQATCGQWPDRD